MRRNLGKRRRLKGRRRVTNKNYFTKSNTHYIYQFVVNGKSYIGYTSRHPEIRKSEHIENARKGKLNKFYNTLRKYKYEYTFEILKEFPEEFLALCYEIQTIAKLNTTIVGLNTTVGGQGKTMEVIVATDVDGNKIFRRRKL